MKRSLLMYSFAALVAAIISTPASAQSKKIAPGAYKDKQVKVGYGLDRDQPFSGADPDGTGLPFKEPPPEAVEAAKKAPTPHLSDGHIGPYWFLGTRRLGLRYHARQGQRRRKDVLHSAAGGWSHSDAAKGRSTEEAHGRRESPSVSTRVSGQSERFGGSPKQEGPRLLLRAQGIPARRAAHRDCPNSQDARVPLRHGQLVRAKCVSRGFNRRPAA